MKYMHKKTTHWAVKAEEIKLREANDGIRSKLRATTPCAVIFRTEHLSGRDKYQCA